MRFHQVETRTTIDFGLSNDGALWFRGRICVPNDRDLRLSILREVHSSPYAIHPNGIKMYKDLRELYRWPGLKHEKLAKLYISEIVRLYGVPVSIISDIDPRFTSRLWKKLHEVLGSQLDFSSAFHPQTDGERRVLGSKLISETKDKVRLIREHLKVTSDRQKSYANLNRKDIEYSVGTWLFLRSRHGRRF
ncbi:uncharacterized protein LOC108462545 [Gossypium arboreum]|uniref:uncharacterized protein LOC108462545 n=1 Tax=Gossypium arboreum TaxID=29729 RepID=UPI00081976C3|nr:uncharacterized protein LOC108462545 [Gossypium arboreum]